MQMIDAVKSELMTSLICVGTCCGRTSLDALSRLVSPIMEAELEANASASDATDASSNFRYNSSADQRDIICTRMYMYMYVRRYFGRS